MRLDALKEIRFQTLALGAISAGCQITLRQLHHEVGTSHVIALSFRFPQAGPIGSYGLVSA